MEINKNKYEIEFALAGLPLFMLAEISQVEFEVTPKGDVIWTRAYVGVLENDDSEPVWEVFVRPEHLDLGRVTADSQLFDAIQEVAEALYEQIRSGDRRTSFDEAVEA
jgi:hypothetical protein